MPETTMNYDPRLDRLVCLIAEAQRLARELGLDRDVYSYLDLAKMNATPLIDCSGDLPSTTHG